jgi:hypothetical protein
MIAGCYDMDLYCDVAVEGYLDAVGHSRPCQVTGETRGECIRAARRSGWVITKESQRCPLHARHLTSQPPHSGEDGAR